MHGGREPCHNFTSLMEKKMFKPIMAGTFGAMVVNRKLREIWEAIEILRELASESPSLPPVEAETVTVDSAETVVIEPEDEPFDWRTSDDLEAVKGYALEELGLSIKGTIKKVETARDQIESFLTANGN